MGRTNTQRVPEYFLTLKASILHSNRLDLFPVTARYATPRYVEWMNDPAVYQYLDSGGDYTMEKLVTYLETAEKKDMYFWAITVRDANTHIGNIKLDPVSEKHRRAEFSIMMGERTEWGKGYAEEASRRIIDFAFADLALNKITLGVIAGNLPAVKLYRKLGFETEGVYRRHEICDGQYCDAIRMALFNPHPVL